MSEREREFTPGPWRAENGRVYCSDATGSIVAQCCDFKWVPRLMAEEEANACLMAAAPCLLEALEALIASTEGVMWAVTEQGIQEDAEITAARAAIARATRSAG